MALRTIIALLPVHLLGVAGLAYGIVQARRLIRLHRKGLKIRADRLPDDARRTQDGTLVYRRVAMFRCPLLGKTRHVAESAGSGYGSAWAPGESIPVIVSTEPPHQAVVATFGNLYLFPLACLVVGVLLALVLPAVILLQR